MIEMIISRTAQLVVGSAYKAWKGKQVRELQKILLEEISEKNTLIHVEDVDDQITLMEMFYEAKRTGAANENLRLMARALRGMAAKGQPVYPNKFRKYARILAELRFEEILVLAAFYKMNKQMLAEVEGTVSAGKVTVHSLWMRVEGEVVPGFLSAADMASAAYSCQRHGLLIPDITIDNIGFLKPTPLLDELVEIADMQDFPIDPESL